MTNKPAVRRPIPRPSRFHEDRHDFFSSEFTSFVSRRRALKRVLEAPRVAGSDGEGNPSRRVRGGWLAQLNWARLFRRPWLARVNMDAVPRAELSLVGREGHPWSASVGDGSLRRFSATRVVARPDRMHGGVLTPGDAEWFGMYDGGTIRFDRNGVTRENLT